MQRPSIRYLLIAIGLIAISISFWQSPRHAVANSVSSSGVPYWHFFNFRPLGFYFAVSVSMHVCATLLGIRRILRWLISIIGPTFAVVLYHFYNAKTDPLSATPAMHPPSIIIVNLITFGTCFLVVSGFFSLCLRVTNPRERDQ